MVFQVTSKVRFDFEFYITNEATKFKYKWFKLIVDEMNGMRCKLTSKCPDLHGRQCALWSYGLHGVSCHNLKSIWNFHKLSHWFGFHLHTYTWCIHGSCYARLNNALAPRLELEIQLDIHHISNRISSKLLRVHRHPHRSCRLPQFHRVFDVVLCQNLKRSRNINSIHRSLISNWSYLLREHSNVAWVCVAMVTCQGD